MTIFKLRKRKKISLLLVYVPSLKHGIRHFHVEVVQKQERKVQKRVMQVKVVVLLIKPFFFFWRSRCRSPRWILKSLISQAIHWVKRCNKWLTTILFVFPASRGLWWQGPVCIMSYKKRVPCIYQRSCTICLDLDSYVAVDRVDLMTKASRVRLLAILRSLVKLG